MGRTVSDSLPGMSPGGVSEVLLRSPRFLASWDPPSPFGLWWASPVVGLTEQYQRVGTGLSFSLLGTLDSFSEWICRLFATFAGTLPLSATARWGEHTAGRRLALRYAIEKDRLGPCGDGWQDRGSPETAKGLSLCRRIGDAGQALTPSLYQFVNDSAAAADCKLLI